MIRSLTRSTINNEVWYQSMLVGNTAYIPFQDAFAFDLITSSFITTNASVFTFNNLNTYTNYKHLQIRTVLKGSSTVDNIAITINNDASAVYDWHRIHGGTTNAGSSNSINAASILITNGTGQSTVANNFSATIIDILDFSSANKNKSMKITNGTAVSNNWVTLMSGGRNSLEPINSITFTFGGTWVSGGRFSLYGIKG